jgi:hypothetical protein
MAVQPRLGLIIWPEYTTADISAFVTTVVGTIGLINYLIPSLRDSIDVWQAEIKRAKDLPERVWREKAVQRTREQIQLLLREAKLLDGNKRAAVRELERRKKAGETGPRQGERTRW